MHSSTLYVKSVWTDENEKNAILDAEQDNDDKIYRAAINDDVNLFKSLYYSNVAKQKHYLGGDLNLSTTETDIGVDISFVMIYNVTRLFHLAVCKSKDILKFMIEEGADVTQADRSKHNALHVLCLMTYLDHVSEEQSIEAYDYLTSLIDTNDLKTLLHATGKVGARPIEIAATFNCGALFQKMMNTPDVYVVDTVPYGIYDISYYDVTDYEDVLSQTSRRAFSPIYIFTTLDLKMLPLSETARNFSSPIFQTWAALKLKTSSRYFTLFFLLRILLVLSFLLFDMLKCSYLCYSNYKYHVNFKPFCMNVKSPAVLVIVGKTFVLTQALGIALCAITSIINHHHKRNRWIFNTPSGPKSTMTFFMFYFVAELITAAFLTIHESLSIVEVIV